MYMSVEAGEGILHTEAEDTNGTLGGGNGDLKPKMQFSSSSEFAVFPSVFL